MIPLTQNLLAIQIPEDSQAHFIRPHHPAGTPSLTFAIPGEKWMTDIMLPPASWSILGTAKDGVPEFECEGMVEKIHVEESPSPGNDWSGGYHYAYVDYMNKGEYAGWQGDAGAFRKSKQSFSSLLHSCGCGVGRWLVLKKEK